MYKLPNNAKAKPLISFRCWLQKVLILLSSLMTKLPNRDQTIINPPKLIANIIPGSAPNTKTTYLTVRWPEIPVK